MVDGNAGDDYHHPSILETMRRGRPHRLVTLANVRGIVCVVGFWWTLGLASAFANSVTFDGVFTQGGLIQGRVPPGSTVAFDGRPVRVSSAGIFLLGFGRDAKPKAEVMIEYPDGTKEHRVFNVKRRQYDIQRIDGLPPKKVTPSAADLERIKQETELVKRARKRDDPRTDFAQGFRWPLVGRISGVYGSQRILNGKPRRPHYGVDIASPTGTPVVAPASGVATLVHPDMYFSGGTLIIDHGHGLSSAFMHLHRILVAEGERIRQGQVIAEVGATGRVTGPHLDWRMNLFEVRVDPTLIVAPMPTQ